MKDPHDLLWKFWVSKEMAREIILRDLCIDGEHYLYLRHILQKEWLR